jgi:RHS repeat-associated protein
MDKYRTLIIGFLVLGFLFSPLTNLQTSKSHAQTPTIPSNFQSEVRFIYDGDGNRTAKIENGNVTIYLGDTEVDLTSGKTGRYYSLGKSRIAFKKGNALAFLNSDHLGSNRQATDNNGLLISEAKFYPFGGISNITPTFPSRRYTGQVLDTETDLYFFNARYYNPSNGLFIQADRVEKNLNKYSYAANNPLRYNDPTGQDEEDSSDDVSPIDFYYGGLPTAVDWDNYLYMTVEIPDIVKAAFKNAMSMYPMELQMPIDILAVHYPKKLNKMAAKSEFGRNRIVINADIFSDKKLTYQDYVNYALHEYAHQIFLPVWSDNDPTQKKIYGLTDKPEGIYAGQVQREFEDLMYDNLRYKKTGSGLEDKNPVKGISKNDHIYDNWAELFAYSSAAYLCPECYKHTKGYNFPFDSPTFNSLNDFYKTLYKR